MKPEKKEMHRQAMHLITGIAIVAIIHILSTCLHINYALIKILIFMILTAGLIIALASKKLRIPVIWWFLKKFERPQDLKTFPGKGVLFMFLGIFLSLLFFPKDVALASITILAIGDSIAPIVGMHYGKRIHPFSCKRYLEGFAAGIAASFAGAMFFVPWPQALIASAAAMVTEGIDIELKISPANDNLTMPLVAGFAILIIRAIL